MRTPHPTLTPQELAIMKVVWRLGDATVRQVYETLREKRPIAYTTVMTMMKILEEKGYLKKALDRDDRAELADTIDRYRRGLLPLIVPITLLDHHFRRAPDPYVAQQVYLHPHPPELMLRNLI